MKHMKVSPTEKKKKNSHRVKKKKDFHLTCAKKSLPSLKMTYRENYGSYEKRVFGRGGEVNGQ